jgi:glycine cleavage system T protein
VTTDGTSHARVVVVGAGIAGASIAYHLALLGWRDVVVLDQGNLAGGTTSHAPGLLGQLRSSVSLTRMLMYSASLYKALSCGEPGFDEVGSLRLASSRERYLELQRQFSFARGVGLEAHLLSPSEALELFPLMDASDILGALYLPQDGSARASILTSIMIDRGREMGVDFRAWTPVEAIDVRDGRVRAVRTSGGRIETEIVVVAAGIWSPLVARMPGISLPLAPMQHQYVAAGPVASLKDRTVPNLRDPDRLVYMRQDGDDLVVGGYERNPRPYPVDAIPSAEGRSILPFDREHFVPLFRAAVERVPELASLPLIRQVNGLESFTSDGEFLLGPSSDVRGLWVACGFCAHGVSGAGGVGKMIAEWIVEDEPSLDLWHMDIRRIGSYAGSERYVRQRAFEVYSTYYDISHPSRDRTSARNLRCSPMYERLRSLGASFGEKAGWERPNWFVPNEAHAAVQHRPRGLPSSYWSPAIAAEHEATRGRAGLFDVTSFSKLEIAGSGALGFLQRLAANELDKPPGHVTYTQLLNVRGGVECDLTVTRLATDRFMLITGAAFGTHDLGWISSHLPADGSVTARDITSSLCCVGLWGPRARDILQSVCDNDVGNASFPYLRSRRIAVGSVPALALRVTYVGELGWEIYAPMEDGRILWDTLWEAGAPLGAVAAGYRAIDSLRLEKGYRYWSADIHSEYTPYEAGLGFAVRLGKGDFIGKAALVEKRETGIQRKLCCLVLSDPTAWALGDEALLDGDQVVGRVTSGGFGYTVHQSIAYGYLPVEFAEPGTRVDVLWFGERIPATVAREPLYDPTNTRTKQ